MEQYLLVLHRKKINTVIGYSFYLSEIYKLCWWEKLYLKCRQFFLKIQKREHTDPQIAHVGIKTAPENLSILTGIYNENRTHCILEFYKYINYQSPDDLSNESNTYSSNSSNV